MKSIQEVLAELPTPYTGSQRTYEDVASQIFAKFGPKAREEYDPHSNCRSFRGWLEVGRCVKKGSKALKSLVLIEEKDSAGKIIKKWPKKINLFYISQTEPLKQE